MLTRTYSATIEGITPTKVEIEIESTQGIPGCIIIGLPSLAVTEAKERITAALSSCGIPIKAKRTIINLAPADVRKTSSHLELGIAIGIIKHYGLITINTDDTLFLGELSLDGTLKPIRGALSLVIAAARFGFTTVVLPKANAPEVSTLTSVRILAVATLGEYVAAYTHGKVLNTLQPTPFSSIPIKQHEPPPQVIGQEQALRALTIAAAGNHPLLFLGQPGVGKSILARSLQALLPPLDEEQSLEVTQLHSLAGLAVEGMCTQPPFRAPHHTTSLAGLLGGGNPFQPGELSLAHHGVLFLDELPEFQRNCLESLREPLETHAITVSRAARKFTLPASTLIIATANPCPCGFLGSQTKVCRCSLHARQHYLSKFSGPLLDRIELHVWVHPIDPAKLITLQVQPNVTKYYTALREKVARARQIQSVRLQQCQYAFNSRIPTAQLSTYCALTIQTQRFLIGAARKLQLSPRAIHACIRVARTISDLSSQENISVVALQEAVSYRQQLIPDMLHS